MEVAVPVPTAATSRTVPMAGFEFVDGVRATDVVALPAPMPSEPSSAALLALMLRSAAVPVEITSWPELTVAAVAPVATVMAATPAEFEAVFTPGGRVHAV